MLVSTKWLKELVDYDLTPQELADKMSLTGIEVEGIEVKSEGLKKIVVGNVLECVPHPDSDHLSICQVDVGESELYQIVCGAPNVKSGIKVIVALPSARIAGNYKIKKGKIRGEVSLGMICSLTEIGFSDSVVPKEYADGIYYLPENAEVGKPVFEYLDMDDAIIELSITPNRADALSMRGVAYEVGAIVGKTPNFADQLPKEDENDTVENYISIKVENEQDTPTYKMRVIKNVKIAPSPLWLQNRLMSEGIRPINNVVDVTNFILLYFGQPLHAFDYDKLNAKEIFIRRANAEEMLRTLDGEERKLASEHLVITSGGKPVALAGVMGGENTEIDESSTTVALEAALFDPQLIRQASKAFNLRSESSLRFEKGINKATVSLACDVAAAMIAELSGGVVVSGVATGSERTPEEVIVGITLEKINRSLGTSLHKEEVEKIFDRLGFEYRDLEGDFSVKIPPRRWDISIEADIVEEVARIYGYDNLPSTLPQGTDANSGLSAKQKFVRNVQKILEGYGLQEIVSYALTTEEKAQQFTEKASNITHLDWPMTEERTSLRQSLVSGLLDNLSYNIARKNSDLAFYEIGRVFENNQDPKLHLPKEIDHLSFALSGLRVTKDWQTQVEKVDFFTAKGILEGFFQAIGVAEKISYVAWKTSDDLHAGRTAKILLDNQEIGFIGQVHPNLAKSYDLPEVYVCELNLDVLAEVVTMEQTIFEPISKFPLVTRDIALLVNEEITNQAITQAIFEVGTRFLKKVHLFDLFAGEKLGAGKKSLAYSLTFSNAEATLTDEEINAAMEKITSKLEEMFGAEIR
ncbi:phenylalanyl-tRNA synthetase beta subunit [Pilibacter termitis]|uniref:Phenylalanine--tRNA ligase beta subunit n=1 Tax=Pilibacter termitis TaxID=263852 RepID=A0A1T4K7Z6_9ENTE|nr:phenylalanine--tRNA ligase subunit beta [Pilibacter termitis]SJZ38564.1 phenylalanyl-tRNA synthetase beta subunit [Pilibacter termitis]